MKYTRGKNPNSRNGFILGHKLNIGNKYAVGMKHTEGWKEESRLRMLGNTQGFKIGKSSPRKGKKSTKPAWNKGLSGIMPSGENHPRWIKDRDMIVGRHNRNFHDSGYKVWRKSVWGRDGYKCKVINEDCNGRIEAHHIFRWIDFPKLRYEVNNGITLCHFHHPRTRKKEDELKSVFLKKLDLNISHLISETKNEKGLSL